MAATGPLAALLGVLLWGCAPFVPADGGLSYGRSNRGLLRNGAALEREGAGYVLARPTGDASHGTQRLVRVLRRAFLSVDTQFPGAPPMRVGDLSSRDGGRHPRHGSHRSGRDVDLIFHMTDEAGRPVRGRGWLAFDRFGVARETSVPGDGEPSNRVFFYDDARNWHLVRTMLLDEEARVQWIFCSNGLKARLLRHAAEVESDPRALARASHVLHQPSSGRSHSDHFHIRLACSRTDRAGGCEDYGPIWPWWADDEKRTVGEPSLTDEALIDALMEPLDEPA